MTNVKNNIKSDKFNDFGIEDRGFPLSFMILKISGYWKPTIFKKPFNVIYDIYEIYCVANVLLLMITIILHNIHAENSIYFLIENLFLIITIFNGLCKVCNIYFRRSNILDILQILLDVPWTVLRDVEETKIIKKSVTAEKFISRFCISTVIVNIISYASKPIMNPNPDYELVIDAYALCDRSTPLCFWLSYVHQISSYSSTCLVQVGYDCVLFNFIQRISCLLKILEHRILKLPNLVEIQTFRYHDEINYIKECIKEHHSICKAVKALNDSFYETVFIQLISSILTMCTNIYLLSMQDIFSSEFNAVFIFLCCLFTQNFLFCWFGFKISTNSLHVSNSIFNMNWCILQKESKTMLAYVMLKTAQPIYLFSKSIIRLTPESFINIVKVSYSAFNILQHTSKK